MLHQRYSRSLELELLLGTPMVGCRVGQTMGYSRLLEGWFGTGRLALAGHVYVAAVKETPAPWLCSLGVAVTAGVAA